MNLKYCDDDEKRWRQQFHEQIFDLVHLQSNVHLSEIKGKEDKPI